MSNGKNNKKSYKKGKQPKKENGTWINQYTPYKHLLDETSHELPVKSLDTIIKPIERNLTSLTSTTSLVHENRHVTEWRWEEGSELVTHVCMKKRGRAWRSIVYRETIEDFQDTFS